MNVKVFVIVVVCSLVIANIISVGVVNFQWQKATVHVVAQHNKVGSPRSPVSIEEMTPEKLKKLTDPCTIWDWRERGKVCKK